MRNLQPEIMHNFGEPFAVMVEDPDGGYVSIDELIEWVKLQRNDVPITGEELANTLQYVLGVN